MMFPTNWLRGLRILVGAAGFELATPCSQAIGIASVEGTCKGSVYNQFQADPLHR